MTAEISVIALEFSGMQVNWEERLGPGRNIIIFWVRKKRKRRSESKNMRNSLLTK